MRVSITRFQLVCLQLVLGLANNPDRRFECNIRTPQSIFVLNFKFHFGSNKAHTVALIFLAHMSLRTKLRVREKLIEIVTFYIFTGAENFNAIIVGAGFSGIELGRRLNECGLKYVILEKSSGLGGTWYDNRYPGAACDVTSHLYRYK